MRKLVALAVIAGCYAEAKPVAAPVTAPSATTHPYARTIADPLGFLPRDTEIVMALDATALRRTPLWARLEPMLAKETAETLDPIKTACGIDVLRQVERITIGARQVDDSDGVLVIAGLDRPQLMACMMRVAKSAPQSLHIERNVVVLAPDTGGDKPVAFMFVDARTLLVVVGPTAKTAEGVRAIASAGSPLRANERIMEMFGRILEPHHGWVILDVTGKALASFNALGAAPSAFLATVDAPAGATAQAILHMKTDADAATLTATFQNQVQAIRGMVDRIEVKQDGVDVQLDLALTEAQVTTMLGLLGL